MIAVLQDLAEWAEDNGVMLGFIQPGKPAQNAYIERFNRTYREGIPNLHVFRSLSEVRERTDRCPSEYNEIRPHESPENLTPDEYRKEKESQENSTYPWN